MPNEPSTEVMNKLHAATKAMKNQNFVAVAVPPPPLKESSSGNHASASPGGVAGNATAKYLLVDHYFGGSSGTFWGYDGSTWRGASESQPADEAGLPQVAFTSNRVDLSWDANDTLTLVRCWKFL